MDLFKLDLNMCVKSLLLHLDASEEQQGEKVLADVAKGGRGKFSQLFFQCYCHFYYWLIDLV